MFVNIYSIKASESFFLFEAASKKYQFEYVGEALSKSRRKLKTKKKKCSHFSDFDVI